MEHFYEIRCFLEEDGKIEPFNLTISKPRYNPGGDDFFCIIKAPKLFIKSKNIYGVNERQAEILALEFVKMMVDDKRLIDKEGKQIEISEK